LLTLLSDGIARLEEWGRRLPKQVSESQPEKNLMKTKQSILHYVAASLVAAAMISVTTAASAKDQVPFKGIVSGSVISVTPIDQCHQLAEAVNGGTASHMGRFTGTAEFVLDVCNLTYVGSYVFTAANGDSISGPFSGTLTPTAVPGVFDNTEIAFITSGTGRFCQRDRHLQPRRTNQS